MYRCSAPRDDQIVSFFIIYKSSPWSLDRDETFVDQSLNYYFLTLQQWPWNHVVVDLPVEIILLFEESVEQALEE